VKGIPSLRRCTLARMLVLGLVIALSPVPALAGGPPPQQPTAKPAFSLAASVDQAALSEAIKPAAPARSRSSQGGADLSSPSFFRTKTGIVVLAVLGAGVGYAIYSTQHDRIISPVKQ